MDENDIPQLNKLDKDIVALDKEAVETNKNLIKLTKWIIALTLVMIVIGIIQLFVAWPKRTYCLDLTDRIQMCEPDYWPFDTNPNDPVYKLDKIIK